MSKKIFLGLAVLILLVGLGSVADPGRASPPATVNQNVLAAYEELEVYINGLADNVLAKGQRNSLIQKLENSEAAYLRGQPCPAANVLRAYLNEVQALHKGKRLEIAEDLYNRGWTLYYDLLTSLPADQVCSGHPRVGLEPAIAIGKSDNQRFQASVTFSEPRMGTVTAGGETFTQLHFPGLEAGEVGGGLVDIGRPGIQTWHRLIALPAGAKPVLRVLERVSYSVKGVNLYPHQESPVDSDYAGYTGGDAGDDYIYVIPPPDPLTFVNPPFTKDQAAYQQDAQFPPQAVSVRQIGRMRDLNVVQISIALAQYNPAAKLLTINTRVNFEVTFEGGSGYFLPEQVANPFESYNFRPMAEQSFLNGLAIFAYISPDVVIKLYQGEELLIITHPDFLDAANDLRSWKQEKGIVTSVFQTGPIADGKAGTTKEEIRNFIRNRYDTNAVRPSYVLLLGDAEFIPCWYRDTGSGFLASDLDYALMDSTDDLADLALARIPVDTLQQAQTVVDKIINYEKNPPLNGNFYRNVSIPAYFQCCRNDVSNVGTDSRAFVEGMEQIRDHLVGQGYTVERIYNTSTAYHTTFPNNYTGDPTPRRYYNGTLLPNGLLPASMGGAGFTWPGSTADISAAINAGRFLVIHRDHGGPGEWSDPNFTTGNVNNLTNGSLLPVVFSVNCASGLFDNETAAGALSTVPNAVYLVETFLRKSGGGAVGVLGDSRNSPTWANNALVRGFVDAIFPNLLASYGGSTSIRRLADILNYGKLYMFSQVGVAQTAVDIDQTNANVDNIIWHAFGDPTQEIWTSYPYVLSRHYKDLKILSDSLQVFYEEEGAVITATQNNKPLGRAPVKNGVAELKFVAPLLDDIPIQLSASKLNYVSTRLSYPIEGPD